MKTLSLLLILTLASCSTWNEKKCVQTNWNSLGLSDGQQGKADKSNYYVDKCSEYSSVNITAYKAGHASGNKNFCESSQGYNQGKSGAPKDQTCLHSGVYQRNYSKGLDVFCSYDKGYEVVFENQAPISICEANPKYAQGLRAAQKSYCSENNAFEVGKKGEAMNNICSSQEKHSLDRAYKKGYDIYLENRISLLQEDYQEIEYKLSEVERQISGTNRTLSRLSPYSSDPNVQSLRRELLSDLDGYRQDRIRYENDLSSLASEVKKLRREATLL